MSKNRMLCECSARLVKGVCPVCSALKRPYMRRKRIDVAEKARDAQAKKYLLSIEDARAGAAKVLEKSTRPTEKTWI